MQEKNSRSFPSNVKKLLNKTQSEASFMALSALSNSHSVDRQMAAVLTPWINICSSFGIQNWQLLLYSLHSGHIQTPKIPETAIT